MYVPENKKPNLYNYLDAKELLNFSRICKKFYAEIIESPKVEWQKK